MVKLTTADNETFDVARDVAERSGLIKQMIEDLGETDNPIPLPNVTAPILKKVLEYCEHHRKDPLPSSDETDEARKAAPEIADWDKKFLTVDQETLCEIIMAANYLDIRALLDAGCITVVLMIKGKSVEEIRKLFNIENDFTPEEEERVIRENQWAEDI